MKFDKVKKMEKEIILNNSKVFYSLQLSKRSKRLSVTIRGPKNIVVCYPRFTTTGRIERFLKSKEDWILKRLNYFKQFEGMKSFRGDKKEYLEYKEKALTLAQERIKYFNQFYNFRIGKITIKNQKTRWGSCSKKGNINFNYRIALLVLEQRDYIIVHEICHLGEFNHSKKFWDLVEQTIPNYKCIRSELKKGGMKFYL